MMNKVLSQGITVYEYIYICIYIYMNLCIFIYIYIYISNWSPVSWHWHCPVSLQTDLHWLLSRVPACIPTPSPDINKYSYKY